MTVDKRMSYEMQGGKKPARNYLGKQKTVSNVPIKWKSGPDAPETELAYITKAEKDLLLKKNLHGSLKNGPNTGPDDIMSLDSQGDYTRDRSPGAYGGGSRQSRDRNEQHMREILTGQKNIGQTAKTGPRTRQYSNLPEYMKVKQKDGTYKDKYIGSAYKSYGTPSFWGNLFSRGAPGYRGIKGLSAFGTPTFEATQGPDGWGYYTDDTDFGETRGAMPFGIMGIIANAINKFKKPKDMSQYSKLQLVDGELVDDPRIDKIPVPGESAWSDGTFTWGGKQPPVSKQYYGIGPVPPSDPFANPIGPRAVNIRGPYETAADDYWSDKQIINTPGGEIVIDSEGNEVVDTPATSSWQVPPGMMSDAYQDTLKFYDNLNKGIVEGDRVPLLPDANVMQGSVLDAQPKKGIMETLSDWNPLNLIFGSPAGAAELSEDELNIQKALGQKTYADTIKEVLPGGKITNTVPDLSNADVLNQIALQSGMPTEKKGVYGFREDVATPESASTIRDIQNLKRNPELEFGVKDIMELGLDKYNQLGEEKVQSIYDMVNLPNQGPFIGARGGRVGYANGGLASLFTRRG